MASTTRDAFDKFYAAIQPTDTQISSMATKRIATHNYLIEGFGPSSDMPLIRTELIGSAQRATIIRPVDDIDVMAVFSDSNDVYENTYVLNSHAFINRIRRVLGEGSTATVGVRGQAVRLFYKSGAHVDIAPVFAANSGGYLLPSGNGGWITTDPDKQFQWFKSEVQRLGSHLLPTIRLLKRWNNVHSKHFNSYHLEVVIAHSFGSLGGDWRDNLAKFFEWAPGHLGVADPAGHSGKLDDYLGYAKRQALLLRLSNAGARAKDALAAEARGDHKEAIRLWRIELGDEFPAYY